MMTKLIPMACLVAMLGFSAPSTAQFGDAVKDVGKATAQGAKTVGSDVKHGTEKATTATKNAVAGRPQGTTGRCKDGTYTAAKTRSSACSKHGGVAKWY